MKKKIKFSVDLKEEDDKNISNLLQRSFSITWNGAVNGVTQSSYADSARIKMQLVGTQKNVVPSLLIHYEWRPNVEEE